MCYDSINIWLYIIIRTIHGCLDIPDLHVFLVLDMISHSTICFILICEIISCCDLEPVTSQYADSVSLDSDVTFDSGNTGSTQSKEMIK